jgi:hypothetical protein
MKQCKCEHWQTCPTCYPQAFDSEGNRLPPKPTPLEAAKLKIAKLEARIHELEELK